VRLIEGEELIWRGKPSWRSMMSFYVAWAAVGLVPLAVIVLLPVLFGVDAPVWFGLVIFAAVVVIAILVGWVRRNFTQYLVTTKRITVRRGILAKTEQTAHVDRVQNVAIHQTPFDRLFKVGTVDFDTAGAEETHDELRFYGVAGRKRSATASRPSTSPASATTRAGSGSRVAERLGQQAIEPARQPDPTAHRADG
jgi:uncharacterized membrane protein YdbT with pleckstrin-like domain